MQEEGGNSSHVRQSQTPTTEGSQAQHSPCDKAATRFCQSEVRSHVTGSRMSGCLCWHRRQTLCGCLLHSVSEMGLSDGFIITPCRKVAPSSYYCYGCGAGTWWLLLLLLYWTVTVYFLATNWLSFVFLTFKRLVFIVEGRGSYCKVEVLSL